MNIRAARGFRAGVLFCLMAGLCIVSICMPTQAFAVVNLGQVSISMPGYASLTAGESDTMSCVVSPMSSSQIPNCATDYCPSGCEAVSAGCLDASGQCTCNGGGYSTYYSAVNVYSSNPGVARASWNNGTLCVSTYAAGTATLTATASLRLHTDATASMTVDVAEPAAAPAANENTVSPSGNATATNETVTSGGVTSSPVSSSSGSANVSTGANAVVASIVGSAAGIAVGDNSASGGQTLVASLSDADVSPKDLIGQVAGTADQVMFWAGSDEAVPDYIWYASGTKITAAPENDVNLSVVDATASNTQLSELLKGKTYCCMDASACGVLPGPMTLLWRTAKVFPNDTYVTLYSYDSSTNKLTRIQKNLQAKDGYVSFEVTEGKVFVLSDDPDLESAGTVAMTDVDTIADDMSAEGTGSSDSNQPKQTTLLPWVVGIGLAVLIAAIVFGIYRKHHQKSGETSNDATSSCNTAESRIDITEDNKVADGNTNEILDGSADTTPDETDVSQSSKDAPSTMKGEK